jgi:hypothetical protein
MIEKTAVMEASRRFFLFLQGAERPGRGHEKRGGRFVSKRRLHRKPLI